MFLCRLVPWPPFDIQVKFYGDRLRGTPPSGELNTKGGAELITNRKWHMCFRLVPNSMTLDDLEQRNSPNGSVISPNSVAFGTDCV